MSEPVKVPYLDLRIQDAEFRAELLEAVDRVFQHGRFILGPEHDQFEKAVAKYCNTACAVGVGSGSDALYLALRALDIGPGDEVITTPLTWVASTNAIALTGATPVFADIGTDLNIDAGKIEAAITPNTRAILPVHFTGQMCDMDVIMEIGRRHGVTIVEDAAQAFGASYKGAVAGSIGEMGCFSMNPMKILNGFGEAGMVATDNPVLRDKLISLRYAGTINKENCVTPSINGRLDTIQAAMLLVNLKILEPKITARRRIAAALTKRLEAIVEVPKERNDRLHTYYSYTIACDQRDELMIHLRRNGIETKIQHPILMPDHDAYRDKLSADIPVARDLVRRIVCIPNHENLTDDQIDYVVTKIRGFYGQ